eukprot:3494294-Pyramimonas_sp.AAC.1
MRTNTRPAKPKHRGPWDHLGALLALLGIGASGEPCWGILDYLEQYCSSSRGAPSRTWRGGWGEGVGRENRLDHMRPKALVGLRTSSSATASFTVAAAGAAHRGTTTGSRRIFCTTTTTTTTAN